MKKEGFTLIEILIVIVIINIFFILALNLLSGFRGISKERIIQNAVDGLKQEQKILAESGMRVNGQRKCYGIRVKDKKLYRGVFDYYEVKDSEVDFCDVNDQGWIEVNLDGEVSVENFQEVYVGQ